MLNSKIRKVHVRQMDQSDCGVACLLSALKFYDGYRSLERLRELSGTSRQGTTLLGLREAALQLGFQAEGYKSDMASLKTCGQLAILHTIKDGRLQHFLLCYGYDAERDVFIIGDPAESKVKEMSESELAKIWQSGFLLLLEPTEQLVPLKNIQRDKWFWIKHLIREDFNILGVALGLGIVVAILGISTAVFSQKLLDNIIPSGNMTQLLGGTILLVLLLLLKSGFGYLRQLFLLRQGKAFNIRIIDFFYSRLLHLPKAFFDNRKTGDLIARMNDTQRIQRTISKLVSSVMIDLLTVIVASYAILVYNWQVGLITLSWIPIFAYLVYRFHPHILGNQQAVMRHYAHNESNYVDTIQGIGPIKLHNRQKVFIGLTKQVYSAFQEAFLQLGKVGIRFGLASEIVGNIFIVSILSWSAYNVITGALTTGAMIAILQLIGMLMSAAAQLAVTNIELQEARVAFDRMYEFTSIHGEYEEEAEFAKKEIEHFDRLNIEKMSFRYPGQHPLFTNISLQVSKGEWVTILGESGCGKSTLLQILQKFYTYESGVVQVNDLSLGDLGFENWRSKLGVVPQQVKIFNGTLLDNILLGAPAKNEKQLEHFFKYYGFDRFFSRLPNGYATLLGEDGINISGGQQQLVALARALYSQPELLLLDEPTAALDRDTEQFVLALLNRLKEEMGILILTHRLRTAKAADRIYIIENGQIGQFGEHRELLNSDNLYSRAWQDLVVS